MIDPAQKYCHLTWHVTSRCDLACKHCLRRAPGQPTEELSTAQYLEILASFIQFAKDTGRSASIEFSGGNPLLREDFVDILRATHAAKRAGIITHVRILANPEGLDEKMVETLKEVEVDDYFISLDGLEAVNDGIRGKGNFQAALRGIRALVKAGIQANVKATVFRPNAHQVVDMLKLALAEGVGEFRLGPLIIAGSGYPLRNKALSPAEYRNVLLGVLDYLDSVAGTHAEFRRALLTSERMFALLFHELGRLHEYRELCSVPAATVRPSRHLCSDGRASRRKAKTVMFVVWSDGEVVLRREMQRQGWAPQDSFKRIYDHSYMLRLLEDPEFMDKASRDAQWEYAKCRSCPVADYCPPVLVGTFGARPLFVPNEQCWSGGRASGAEQASPEPVAAHA